MRLNKVIKEQLYLPLVRSQFLFGSVLWKPNLLKDIKTLERLQRRATKYTLNDYASDYKHRLLMTQDFSTYVFSIHLRHYVSDKFPNNLLVSHQEIHV